MSTVQYALGALLVALTGIYAGSSLLGLVAVSLAALSLSYQGHPLLTSYLGYGMEKNILLATYAIDSVNKVYAYKVKYYYPKDFVEYAFVYKPSDVFFDYYYIQPSYKAYANLSFNRGRRTHKGEVVPQDPSQLAIKTISSYKVPKVPQQPNDFKMLKEINFVFCYKVREDAASNATYFNMFRNLLKRGNFCVYIPGKGYTPLDSQKRGPNWNVAPL